MLAVFKFEYGSKTSEHMKKTGTVNDRFSGHRFSGNDCCFSGKNIRKKTVLEENKLVLFTGFEDTTALEDKKGLTVFSAKPVVHCSSTTNQV